MSDTDLLLNERLDKWVKDISTQQSQLNSKNLLGWGVLLGGVILGVIFVFAVSEFAWAAAVFVVAGLAAGIPLLVRSQKFKEEAVKSLTTDIIKDCEEELISRSDAVKKLWDSPAGGAICKAVLAELDPNTVAILELRQQALNFFNNESRKEIQPVNVNVNFSGDQVSNVTVEGEQPAEEFSFIATKYLSYGAYIEAITALAVLHSIYVQIAPPGYDIMISGAQTNQPLQQVALTAHKIFSTFDFKPEIDTIYELLTKKRTQSLLKLLLANQHEKEESLVEQSAVEMASPLTTDKVFIEASIDYLGKLTEEFFKKNKLDASGLFVRNKVFEILSYIPDYKTFPYILKAFDITLFFPQGVDAVLRMDRKVRDELLEAFKTGSTNLRFNAGISLGMLDPKGVKFELQELLPSLFEPVERIACYFVSARAGDEGSITEIVPYLDSHINIVTHGAAIALEHLNTPIDEEVFKKHLNHKNELVRLRLLRKLGFQRTTDPILFESIIKCFDDDEEMVRNAAVKAITSMDKELVYDSLLEAANKETKRSRICALDALGKIGKPDVLPTLTNALKKANDDNNRRTVISALGELGDKASLDEIKPYLKRKELSTAAYWAVLRIGLSNKDAALKILQQQGNESIALFMRILLEDEKAKEEYKKILSAKNDIQKILGAIEYAGFLRDPDFEKPLLELVKYRRHPNFPADRYIPYLAVKALVQIKLATPERQGEAG